MSDTRERLIRTTAGLLMLQGYHGTGLNQIVRESGAPRGSLYYHFPNGKEELAAEAVLHRGEAMRRHVAEELARADDSAEAVALLVRTMIANMLRREFTAGAPIAGVAMEASGGSEILREACAEVYRTARAPFEEKLVASGLPAERAASLATAIVAALEGALVMSYTERSADPLERVGGLLRTVLESVLS